MCSHQGAVLFKRFRRCGLVRGSVWLEVGSEVKEAHAKSRVSLFLLPLDPDVELSTSLAPCLPVCHYALGRDHNELNLWNCKLTQLNSFIRLAMIMVSLCHNRTLDRSGN